MFLNHGDVAPFDLAPKRKPSKPLLPGIYGPRPPGWHDSATPWEPRNVDEDGPLVVMGHAGSDLYYVSSVRLLETSDLFELLHGELDLPVEHANGWLVAPMWIAALLTWVRCCYDRELYDYRMEAIREIATNHQKTGLHEQIETIWRLGGRVALFDFLRTIY